MDDKAVYKKPEMMVIGKVEDLTRGSRDGNALDADFPAGTPRGKLTFS